MDKDECWIFDLMHRFSYVQIESAEKDNFRVVTIIKKLEINAHN